MFSEENAKCESIKIQIIESTSKCKIKNKL